MKRKDRLPVPKKMKDKILVEFNHSCVCCDAPYHVVHHIDEDPSNNAEDNLIVLCPNCHQGRVHGKSRKITPAQLKLYKTTKSKGVFKPIYNAIIRRITFVEKDEYENLTSDEISTKVKDLIGFISTLEQGEYYAQELKPYLRSSPYVWVIPMPDSVVNQRKKELLEERRKRIKDNKEEILRLVLECAEVQPE
ncbi:MAG TPA: HNH endonuclease signature motif containing protein [Candidatus Avalokitesvara rifleensis]|uniref:HNH endonuclease signature motif containing protein n=1 Tax=Candidatus Avalokitesvara rifleensis TaxID=3367620 RepID=UPI00271429C7|nr:HNH endonuclease signature motif containing protein [Candidatus Brocadiales bacterium]